MAASTYKQSAPCWRKSIKGFTLLEMMLVVIIMGIMLGLATVMLGGSDARLVKDEAKRFVALLDLAAQESVLKSKELLLLVEEDGYSFMVAEEGELAPLDDYGLLRPRQLPEGLQFSVVVEGQAMIENQLGEIEAAQIWILSSGELSPFEITLSTDDGPAYILKGEITGALTLQDLAEVL